jgi:uncharacterized protein YecT (DUF1311 family)
MTGRMGALATRVIGDASNGAGRTKRTRAGGAVMKYRWLAPAAILASLFAFQAAADDKDPIDVTLDACLASGDGQTTAGMIKCTGSAVDAWDAKLNETYRKAMAALDPKSRGLLQNAQRAWLAFRTAERAAEIGPWQSSRGSVARVEIMGNELTATKERAMELRLYMPAD